MDFFTIEQYFNKLFSALFVILLVPIGAFIGSYLRSVDPIAMPMNFSDDHYYLAAIVVADWVLIFILFNKRIKSIRNGQGLRVKLEEYFRLTIVRYICGALGCLVLAYGFYISNDGAYTGTFVVSLLVLGLLWPTSPKVCRDLKLRGDEREMVYYKKDNFNS